MRPRQEWARDLLDTAGFAVVLVLVVFVLPNLGAVARALEGLVAR